MQKPRSRLLAFPLLLLLAACGGEPPAIDVGYSDYGQTVCPGASTLEGGDVSHWQGNIDWAKVKGAGISFAIFKATESTNYFDPQFTANWNGTKANGIIRGAYHFFRPAADATQQADYFVSKAGMPGDGDLPLTLDLEVTDGLGGAAVAAAALKFLQRVEQLTGRIPLIYTSPSFFTNTLGSPNGFAKYHLWIAHWGVNCPNIPNPPWPSWKFWQYTDAGSVAGIAGNVDRDRFNGSLADLKQFVSTAKPIAHGNGNEAMSIVDWPDGHTELFAVTPGGNLMHSYNGKGNDMWSAPAALDGSAKCGFASSFWGGSWLYPEVFAPLGNNATGHLWYTAGKGWNTFQPFGGANLGLGHMSTAVWADGTTQVFALGKDGAIWTNWWVIGGSDWPGWSSLMGTWVTGAGVIRWEDDHVELFTVDAQGQPWHNWTAAGHGKWQGWAKLAGPRLATRPIPTRWDDGHVELFARGADSHLYHAWFDSKNGWQPFALLSPNTTHLGEPSAIEYSKRDGAATEGPWVFARDDQGLLGELHWDGTAFTSFAPIGKQKAASDPLGWVRPDGNLEVFAVDSNGTLVRALRSGNNWSAWNPIGNGFDACSVEQPPPPPPDGGAPDMAKGVVSNDMAGSAPADLAIDLAVASADAGSGNQVQGGCQCRANGRAPSDPSVLVAILVLGLITLRRRPCP